MGFVRHGGMRARDLQKGITIELVHRFEDIGPEGSQPFCYTQGDLAFEFRAKTQYEWRIHRSFVAEELSLTSKAIYLVEYTIRSGLVRAGRPSLSAQEYQELKKNIADGMLAFCTSGGEYFRYVPDFRLGFVEFERDVPDPPPRPSRPDNLIARGSAESALSLGEHKGVGFIFEHACVRDLENDIAITPISKFEDISFDDPVPYIYSRGGLAFEFRASKYREWQITVENGVEKITQPHTATYVIEESIEQGLRASGRSLTSDQTRQLMRNIREGMWAIETSEVILRFAPDFRLEFVRTAKEAPKWAPRPSHWNFLKTDP
jgi:hypothetical protein